MAKRSRARAIFAFLTGVGLASCNAITGAGDLEVEDRVLDASSDTSSAVKADGTVPTDAGSDGSPIGKIDATVIDSCSPTGCVALPEAWNLVAFGQEGAECPVNFGAGVDVVTEATLGPNACTCDCNMTAQPTCPSEGTTIAQSVNLDPGAAACPTNVGTLSGGCTTDGFLGPFTENANKRQYTPTPAAMAGGACNATNKKDPSKLAVKKARVCAATVVPKCGEKICPPIIDFAPFKACVAAPGDNACPADLPTKTLISTTADFVCNGNCGCSVDGNCNNGGFLRFYDSLDCTGAAGVTFPVNSNCFLTNQTGGPFKSHRYSPNSPQGVFCKKTGSTTPSTVQLTDTSTVCCN